MMWLLSWHVDVLFLSTELEKLIDEMVSVITGLIQNTIICVTLAGSGFIRWWPCNEPNVDILFTFLFYWKDNTEMEQDVKW